MNNLKLANRFDSLADKFEEFGLEHGLMDTRVDMGECFDLRDEHEHLCKTPACHGGWGAIILGPTGGCCDGVDFYAGGAHSIAEFLGFDSQEDLEDWAYENPDKWGGVSGAYIFGRDEAAFMGTENKPDPDNGYGPMKFIHIINKHRGIAKRLRS